MRADGQFRNNVTPIDEPVAAWRFIFRSTGTHRDKRQIAARGALAVSTDAAGDVIEGRNPTISSDGARKQDATVGAGEKKRLFFRRVRPWRLAWRSNSLVGLAASPIPMAIRLRLQRWLPGFEPMEVGGSLITRPVPTMQCGHTEDVVTAPRLKAGLITSTRAASRTTAVMFGYSSQTASPRRWRKIWRSAMRPRRRHLRVTPNGGSNRSCPWRSTSPQSKKDQINPSSRGEVAVAIL